jgi:16S rRNA (cytosine967-C5)-methyltransferase
LNTAESLPLAQLLALVADAVLAVRRGRSLDDPLAAVAPTARAGVQALTFQVLRQFGLATELRRLLAPKAPPPWVDALLVSALALLAPGAGAPYAVHTLVDQAVAAVHSRQPRQAGFVNAVLRRFGREADAWLARAVQSPTARFNHPAWWIDRLRTDWPDRWQSLLDADNSRAPMTLRVNRRRLSGAQYLQRLQAAGRDASLLDDPRCAGQTVVLARPCPVDELPGFADGEVSVQDAAAQFAAGLLAPGLPPGARVLDACAAPGGKTAHLLELADLDLLALDIDADRLQRVQQTLQRLHLQGELRAGDAGRPADWWDGRPFDAILLDAPCSASGIVRRHPDIRWLRRASDLPALAARQGRLLDALWPLLKPGGRLLYATCSVFPGEGREVVDAFLQRCPPPAPLLQPASPGQLLPLPENGSLAAMAPHDGFYYALLENPCHPPRPP